MLKYILITASFLGLAALILSSLSAHAIKPMLFENGVYESFKNAQNILMIQSIVAIVAVLLFKNFSVNLYLWSAWAVLLGAFMFSLPIFIKGFNISSALTGIIPFGGSIMMIGWVLMIVASFKIK